MQDTTSRPQQVGRDSAPHALDDTYFLVWRSVLDKPHFADPNLLKVWLWCLAKASYKARCLQVRTGRGTTTVNIQRGQFLFGRKAAADELQMPEGSVRDRMKKLQDLESIAIQPDTHFSVVSVVNFDLYQPATGKFRQATRQPNDSQEPGNGQATDTNKNVRNVRTGRQCRRSNDIDGASFVLGEKRGEVLRLVKRIAKCVRRREPRDLSLIVKSAILQAAGVLAQNDIETTLESFDFCTPDNPAARFHEVLDDKVAKYGDRLNRMLASVQIDRADINSIYQAATTEGNQ